MSEPQKVVEITYDSAAVEPAGPRPTWVWIIVGLYCLLAAGLVFIPAMVMLDDPTETHLIVMASLSVVLLTLCGLGLILTPVRAARRRPMTRRIVLLPILAAGCLLGVLFGGAGIALVEFYKFHGSSNAFAGVWIGGAVVWLAWSAIFWLMSGWSDPAFLAARLHRWVLSGSVAELLVAVPTHLVVRRRTECCAGLYTGTAICIGVVVMLIAFGPSVAFLYYRRWKQKHRNVE
jgi:hypothetical protein